MNKKIGIGILMLGVLFGVVFIAAQSDVSYCCEKTMTGAYCQNAPIEECDRKFKTAATSCENTGYCQKGCCYDSDEGVCMENTPEEACRAVSGQWSDDPSCTQTTQCNLGCCVIGREAAYTTLARCNKISGYHGVTRDFRADVADEISCIALATSQDQGACVFEKDFVNTCQFTTRGECNSASVSEGLTNATTVRFYEDYLCSSEELNTDCARSRGTMCDSDGRVYFVDTCGNRANIYDSSRVNNLAYWNKIVSSSESCSGSARTCGNCEYLGVGSFCGAAERGRSPELGDFICQDVNCYDTSDGKNHKNGESWCSYDDVGNPDTDSVGSRHFRHICFMGEEIVEACADFRGEVCVEDVIGEAGDFSQAGCAVNRWQDCILQNDTFDCLNSDMRDCKWFPIDEELLAGLSEGDKDSDGILGGLFDGLSDGFGVLGLGGGDDEEENSLKDRLMKGEIPGKCIPKVAPGLDFYNAQGTAPQTCSVASRTCVVTYEKKLVGGEGWKPVENEFCLEPATHAAARQYCSEIGDCGVGFNYVGKFTYTGYEISVEDADDAEEIEEIAEQQTQPAPANANPVTFGGSSGAGAGEFSQPAPSAGGTGNVIQGFIVNSYNRMIGKGKVYK